MKAKTVYLIALASGAFLLAGCQEAFREDIITADVEIDLAALEPQPSDLSCVYGNGNLSCLPDVALYGFPPSFPDLGGGGQFPDGAPTPPAVVIGPRHVPCSLCDQLEEASASLKAPTDMGFGDTATVQLALKSDVMETQSLFSPSVPGHVQILGQIPSALQMHASLTSNDFQITASVPELQTVVPNQGALWSWEITPTTDGDDVSFTVAISAVLVQAGNHLPPARPFVHTHSVKVTKSLLD